MANSQIGIEKIPSNPLVRFFFVILLNIVNMIISKLILVLALYQFVCHLITGNVPPRLVSWGETMSKWTYKMMLFMTYKTEHMPFPFHLLGPAPDEG